MLHALRLKEQGYLCNYIVNKLHDVYAQETQGKNHSEEDAQEDGGRHGKVEGDQTQGEEVVDTKAVYESYGSEQDQRGDVFLVVLQDADGDSLCLASLDVQSLWHTSLESCLDWEN
jgi:hypothetical protein